MSGSRVAVLHVVSAGEVGGAERMLVDLAARGETTGIRHAVALFTPSSSLRRFFAEAGVELFDAGPASESPFALLRRTLGDDAVRFVADAGRCVGAGAVHVHTFASQALGTRAATALGVPLVRTEHSTRVYDDPTCWPFARYSLGRASAVVAISQHIAATVRARAPFAIPRLSVIPCGIDPARFPAAPFPADDRELRFVAVGRLDPRKNFLAALDALGQVPNARLTVVGEGEERARLEERMRRSDVAGRAELTGWLADPAASIGRAHVALCSSRREGLGLSLLEAMAVGRPVVTVPVGGVVEFVREGETGFVAADGTAESLAGAMLRALGAREALPALGQRARSLVLERYTADRMARAYAELYRRVCRTR